MSALILQGSGRYKEAEIVSNHFLPMMCQFYKFGKNERIFSVNNNTSFHVFITGLGQVPISDCSFTK